MNPNRLIHDAKAVVLELAATGTRLVVRPYPVMRPKQLERCTAPMLVLAASKGRQFSYEDPKWGGGAFTHALVEVLQRNWRSADLNANGVIEVSELYRALRSMG